MNKNPGGKGSLPLVLRSLPLVLQCTCLLAERTTDELTETERPVALIGPRAGAGRRTEPLPRPSASLYRQYFSSVGHEQQGGDDIPVPVPPTGTPGRQGRHRRLQVLVIPTLTMHV